MDCDVIERQEMIEAYLGGRLSDSEKADFERHAFSCAGCLAKLQALQAVQAEIWEQGTPPAGALLTQRPVRMPRWAFASAFAILLVAAGALLLLRQGRLPGGLGEVGGSGPMAELAEFQAPPYLPASLRGGADEAAERFRRGMDHYQAGRYPQAAVELGAAEGLEPRSPQILFFLGVDELLIRRTDQGIAKLEKVVALGDSPYLAEAHFYLAKAYLRKKDAMRARNELEMVAASASPLADEASRLIGAIDRLRDR